MHVMVEQVMESAVGELTRRSAARTLLEVLLARGVSVAFGIPGGLVSPVFDSFAEVAGFRLVCTRHEAMAGYAAIGHAVATGLPGLVLTTGGPGLTNLVTAAAAAYVDEIPMIIVSGEVSSTARSRDAFQDSSTNAVDAVAMMRTVTRWSARVDSEEGLVGAVEEGFAIATGSRPGPVYLALPVDIGAASCRRTYIVGRREGVGQVDAAACAAVGKLLSEAKRPLIIAGNGARSGMEQLLELSGRLAVPVVTTPHSKGVFPESNPLHLGMIGLGGHPSARRYLEQQPDVVCAIGSRLGEIATDGWTLPLTGSTATIQIDSHPYLVGRNYPVSMGLIGDIRCVLQGIVSSLETDVAVPLRHATGIELAEPEALYSDQVPLHPARVLRGLKEAFPDAFFATDLGEHAVLALHYLQTEKADQFRTMWGLGAMGSGIGMAIGAKHAEPDRTVVCICGDGGFAMHAGDLLTCIEQGINVIFAIMNDGRWNMVEHGFSSVYGRAPASMPSRQANLAGMARELGADSALIEKPTDLHAAKLRELASHGQPLVLDIRVDPEVALSRSGRNESLRRTVGGTKP